MFGADGKTDIFSIPLGNSGESIKDKLTAMIPDAETEADNALLGKTFLQMEELRAKGDTEGARNLGLQSLGLLNDMSKIPSFIRDIESLTQRVTPEMRVNANRMFEREIDGESATALVKDMIGAPVGTYPPAAINQMLGLARQEQSGERTNNPYKQSHTEFNSARKNQSEEFDVGFANYLEYTAEGDKGSYGLSGTGKKELNLAGKRNAANFYAETRQRFFELREEGLAKGDWDPAKGIQQAINETVAAKKEGQTGADVQASSPLQSYTGWADTSNKALYQTASANNGRITEKIPAAAIAPSTLEAWQQANPGRSFESLTGRQKMNLLAESIMTFKKFDQRFI